MDKYRLVPNNLAPYLSQSSIMEYQYGTAFYDNNEGRPDQSGRPREQALGGDGFHYGGQHTMLPFEPIFTSDNVLNMVESELKKTAMGYVQGLSPDQAGVAQVSEEDPNALKRGAKRKQTKAKPKGKAIPTIEKKGKRITKPTSKQNTRKFEEGVEILSEGKDVDEYELKRRRRLLRNRVSAQLARERKKQYVQGLEKKALDSDKKIKELQASLNKLKKENEYLKAQIGLRE